MANTPAPSSSQLPERSNLTAHGTQPPMRLHASSENASNSIVEKYEHGGPVEGNRTLDVALRARAQWLPITLRLQYLTTIIVLTIVILALVIALHVRSSIHSGLGDDNGSSGTFFVSRFLPTLVAVCYVFSLSVILNDVKRTEPYARLSSPHGAPISNTLFYSPLSPFSSTFLVAQDVTFSRDRPFEQLSLSSELPIQAVASSTTYFRTIGNILQNVTTSAWITEKYAILPFWPATQTSKSLGAFLSSQSEVWNAETLVVSTELECEPLKLEDASLVDIPPNTQPVSSFRLTSDSGCMLSMAVDNRTGTSSLSYWTLPSNFAPDDAISSNSTGCIGDDAMLFSTAPFTGNYSIAEPDPDVQAIGFLCSAGYYFANASVSVTVGLDESVVSVDDQAYLRNKSPIPDSFLDIAGLQTLFLNKTSWPQRLFAGKANMEILGPGALLSASYEYSTETILQDQDLRSRITQVKQRFLGEIFRDVFDSALVSAESQTSILGQVLSNTRRIVVVPVVAITLEVVLSLNLVLLLIALFASRLPRRPLELSADPTKSISVANLVCKEPSTMQQLGGSDPINPLGLLLHIQNLWCQIVDNTLYLFPSKDFNAESNKKLIKNLTKRNSLPSVLHLLPVILLFASLLVVAAAIGVLLGFSETEGLYQTAFVYQLDFNVGGMQLDTINPASILTTLLAVCIALWWGSVDSSMRKLQPFLALAKEPVTGEDGVSLTYEASYMLWAAFRAVKRRHWLLALVSCGAFYAEIFTIAMSALWSRTHSTRGYVAEVPVSFESRQIPLLLVGTINDVDYFSSSFAGEVLRESFANQTTSWMYGANIQLSLNGSEPTWSSSGWSFAPVDLTVLPIKTIQNIGNSSTDDERGVPLSSATFATLDTVGIHARLECTPFDAFESSDMWTTKQNLTDSSYWNTTINPASLKTGYELGTVACSTNNTNIGLGYLCGTAGGRNVTTTFYVQPPQLSCCENQTDDGFGPASVGYWSANRGTGVLFPNTGQPYPFNLTVKWIHGIAQEGFVMANASSEAKRLLWQEPPQLTAIECRPIIETANARVTIDIASSRVQNYTLTSDPVPDTDSWTDLFSIHNPAEAVPGLSTERPINVTISHGAYYLASLIGASDIAALTATPRSGYPRTQYMHDQTFNIRNPGLNLDYMSYSMLSLVDFDTVALLDPATLERTAQQTFSTFFQHFASSSVSTTSGGWAFQKLDERLPSDLQDVSSLSWTEPPASPRAGEMVSVEVVQPIEILQMSRAAAAIALAVLLWLMVSSIALAFASPGYKARLRWRVETIADVLVMFTGSDRLMAMLKDQGPQAMNHNPDTAAILADFKTKDGTARWGIELANGGTANAGAGEPSAASTTTVAPNNDSLTSDAQQGTYAAGSTTDTPQSSYSIPRKPLPQLTLRTKEQGYSRIQQSQISPTGHDLSSDPMQRPLNRGQSQQSTTGYGQLEQESPVSPIHDGRQTFD
ncbi:hypothetical protein B0A52_09762 [Exophiala mesophila]|uniref:Uncharacterized protein n=1 Tax=Exophiala mesophila TaxID=212818 RepID=A0A438MRQ6_EXOME|nr:hypothetical protein B0A52_09762 [Exophiala mesophila]